MLMHNRPEIIDHTRASLGITDGAHAIGDILGSSEGVGVDSIAGLIQLGRTDRRLARLVAAPCSGSLAAEAAADYARHAGVYIGDPQKPTGITTMRLGGGTVTIGTATGIADGTPNEGPRFGDTITWSESDYYVELRAALSAPEIQVHSPANNTIARLLVGDVGFADVLLLESVAGLKRRVVTGN